MSNVDLSVAHEIEQFLFSEAALLEDRRYEDWLALMTDDVIYWIPNGSADADPAQAGAICYEGLEKLKVRISRLLNPLNPTQMPPPRTKYFISNVRVRPAEGGELDVRCGLLAYIARDEGFEVHPASCEYRLRPGDGSAWRIARKKVYLIANDQPITLLPLI